MQPLKAEPDKSSVLSYQLLNCNVWLSDAVDVKLRERSLLAVITQNYRQDFRSPANWPLRPVHPTHPFRSTAEINPPRDLAHYQRTETVNDKVKHEEIAVTDEAIGPYMTHQAKAAKLSLTDTARVEKMA